MNSSVAPKLRFFAVYFLSVGFIVAILSLLMGMGSAKDNQSAAANSTADEELWQANQYLHSRVAELNTVYAASVQDPSRRYQNAAAIQKAEGAFATSLDSLQRTIGERAEAVRPAWEQMASAFRQEVETRKALLQAYTSQPQAIATDASANTQQLTDLQQQVQQRDATIAELNQRLASRPSTSAVNNTQADGELTRTNASLRASLEKSRSENEALNRSYKAVVDDHKRVLAQLQAARKQ